MLGLTNIYLQSFEERKTTQRQTTKIDFPLFHYQIFFLSF